MLCKCGHETCRASQYHVTFFPKARSQHQPNIATCHPYIGQRTIPSWISFRIFHIDAPLLSRATSLSFPRIEPGPLHKRHVCQFQKVSQECSCSFETRGQTRTVRFRSRAHSVQATDRSRGDKNPNQSGFSSAEPRSSLPGARKSGADHNNMDRTVTMSRSSCLFRSAGALLPGIGIRGRRNGVRVWITRATVSDQRQLQAERKMDEYNKTMQRQMRNPYEYHHDLGMHFTRIADNLIVGSQPQSARDIDRLKEEESVTDILNLQQDRDIEYWSMDLPSITKRCRDLGIRHTRRPARDFDPLSLRKELPRAVSSLEWAISEGGIVYVHCTAGLGRAPAVAIAYLFWFNSDMDLNKAYRAVTSKRPCGPKRDAIRGATYDLAKNDPRQQAFEDLPEHAFTGVADWERKLIQDRVRALRGT